MGKSFFFLNQHISQSVVKPTGYIPTLGNDSWDETLAGTAFHNAGVFHAMYECQFIPNSSESLLTRRISNSRNKHQAKHSHRFNHVCLLNLAQCLTIGDCSLDYFLLLTNIFCVVLKNKYEEKKLTESRNQLSASHLLLKIWHSSYKGTWVKTKLKRKSENKGNFMLYLHTLLPHPIRLPCRHSLSPYCTHK